MQKRIKFERHLKKHNGAYFSKCRFFDGFSQNIRRWNNNLIVKYVGMYISKQHFKNMVGKNNRIKVVYVGWGSFIKKN